MIRSSVLRAHRQAASARKGSSGHRSGAKSNKSNDHIHQLANELALPVAFHLPGGQTHDCTQAVARLGDQKPTAVIADKVCDTDPILATWSRTT